jgi:hypothetical protein
MAVIDVQAVSVYRRRHDGEGEGDERRPFQHGYPKFLKIVGVTSQREIETAVRAPPRDSSPKRAAQGARHASIPARARAHVDGEIGLS